jgi:hypothetical protein
MHEPLGGPLEGGIVAYVSVIWWNVTPFFIQELPHIVGGGVKLLKFKNEFVIGKKQA